MSTIGSDVSPSSTLGEGLSRVQRVGKSQRVSGDHSLSKSYFCGEVTRKKDHTSLQWSKKSRENERTCHRD